MADLPSYECYPLRNLNELLSWTPTQADRLARSTVAPLTRHQLKDGPRVLLCHDMKGGYLADRYLHGSDQHEAFRFFHWSQIDSFVYFSHHFVTIPPVPWITAGHRNGVPVLGTLITEGNEGFNVCQQMLSNESLLTRVLDQLEQLMDFFQFDGWLVNIENQVEHVPQLLTFVHALKQSCNRVKNSSLVIWYDSVVVDSTTLSGQLRWQNEFNDLNRPFFELCDGIFLNYAWDERQLANSRQLAERLHRPNDVYVGVDIFGRGCFGGGGLQTNQALTRIAQHRLSVALFAPGWVHECLAAPGQFTQEQYQFWKHLDLPDRHVPCTLPIRTSFCQGFGQAFFRNGFRVRTGAWHNLHLQQLQPNHRCGHVHVDDAFEGGGCLHMHNFDQPVIECAVRVQGRCLVTLMYKRASGGCTECDGVGSDDSFAAAAHHQPENQSPLAKLDQVRKELILVADRSKAHDEDLKIHLDATNSVNIRNISESEVLANPSLHQHLKELRVTLLPINGWSSRCFEVVQPQKWPLVLQRVFIRPTVHSRLQEAGLLIGLLTVSCMQSDEDSKKDDSPPASPVVHCSSSTTCSTEIV